MNFFLYALGVIWLIVLIALRATTKQLELAEAGEKAAIAREDKLNLDFICLAADKLAVLQELERVKGRCKELEEMARAQAADILDRAKMQAATDAELADLKRAALVHDQHISEVRKTNRKLQEEADQARQDLAVANSAQSMGEKYLKGVIEERDAAKKERDEYRAGFLASKTARAHLAEANRVGMEELAALKTPPKKKRK